MKDEITYIGVEPEDTNANSNNKVTRKSTKKDNTKKEKFKTNHHNKKVSKFIASTKPKRINKKVVAVILIVLAIYFLKPITFLRNKLDEKREYYSQINSQTAEYNTGIVASLKYAIGIDYYTNCKDTLVYPADGMITCWYDLGHLGIDIACDTYQDNIYAAANGTVISVGYSEKYGNDILIEHTINGMTLYTYYANLSVVNVSVGDYVYQNQPIALEGRNPDHKAGILDTDGHHLHFEVRKSTNATSGLDPLIFLN